MRGWVHPRRWALALGLLSLAGGSLAGIGCDRKHPSTSAPADIVALPTPPPVDAPARGPSVGVAPLARFVVGETPAAILGLDLDRVGGQLSLRVRFDEDGGPVERDVRLARNSDVTWRGARFSIHAPGSLADDASTLAFAVEAQWHRANAHRARVREQTAQDDLTIELLERAGAGADANADADADARLERFTYRGQRAQFEIRGVTSDQPGKAVRAVPDLVPSSIGGATLPSASLTVLDAEQNEGDSADGGAALSLESIARRFRAVVPPGNSLEHNRDGDRLMELLGEPEFARWLATAAGSLAGHTAAEIAPIIADLDCLRCDHNVQRFCLAMSLCSAIKCKIFPLQNPVCHACFGANVACNIAALIEWILGD